jgi:repressor LexA
MTTADSPESKAPLTPRQQEALDFIMANSCLYGPTVREIAAGLSIKHHNAAARHIEQLEAKGYIRRIPGKARGIEVIA